VADGHTRAVGVGVRALTIGGGAPVVIQTMWKERLAPADLEGEARAALLARIDGLADMGCGLLRFAAPDIEAAEVLGRLAGLTPMPLAADIHFDYRIALRCLDFSIAKLRINPGNIGSRDRVEAVLGKAAVRNVPIRIGVNAGSLPKDLRGEVDAGRLDRSTALVRAAERELEVCDRLGFTAVVVSMKASGIADTVKANRLLASRVPVPLHVGVTEAGPLAAGVARSAAALAPLLAGGVGDTIRVSLSDTVEQEVVAAREILRAAAEIAGAEGRDTARLAAGGGRVGIISCPRCGRAGFDTHGFTARWLRRLYGMRTGSGRDVTVAIMGCVVNGPGEARHADLGITGAGDRALIFRRGEVVRAVGAAEADAAFEEELRRLEGT